MSLQNVSKCEIKDITDRHRYWTADPASNAAFRILNPSGGTDGRVPAVRKCDA